MFESLVEYDIEHMTHANAQTDYTEIENYFCSTNIIALRLI